MPINISKFLELLTELDNEKLNQIKGIGPKISDNLIKYINSTAYKNLISKFTNLETLENLENSNQNKFKIVTTNTANSTNIDNKNLKTVCITGTFNQTREEIKLILEGEGYKFVNSVTTQTNYLLAGEKAGSKLKLAEKLQIPVYYSLDEFLKIR